MFGEELRGIPVVDRVVRRVLIDARRDAHEVEVLESTAGESHGVVELIWRKVHGSEGVGHGCSLGANQTWVTFTAILPGVSFRARGPLGDEEEEAGKSSAHVVGKVVIIRRGQRWSSGRLVGLVGWFPSGAGGRRWSATVYAPG